jgi:hypothetical protein
MRGKYLDSFSTAFVLLLTAVVVFWLYLGANTLDPGVSAREGGVINFNHSTYYRLTVGYKSPGIEVRDSTTVVFVGGDMSIRVVAWGCVRAVYENAIYFFSPVVGDIHPVCILERVTGGKWGLSDCAVVERVKVPWFVTLERLGALEPNKR